MYNLTNITIPDEDDLKSTDLEGALKNLVDAFRVIDTGLTTLAGYSATAALAIAAEAASAISAAAALVSETNAASAVATAMRAKQVLSADGAITLKEGTCLCTKAGIIAGTLAAPTATTDDGKMLRIVSVTANAHVITGAVDGFNAKGSSGTLTFGGAIGDAVSLVAYNGHWYTESLLNVVVA